MLNRMVDGLILTNVDKSNYEDLRNLQENHFPFVLVLNRLAEYDGNFVGVDNIYGSELMMNYLYGLGHRKIGFISGPPENNASIERLDGYRVFHEEHDLSFDESLVEIGDFRYGGGQRAVEALVARHSNIDAIFCVNDFTALGAIDAARNLGIRVPQDLLITGFDDMPISSHLNISLTTIRIPILQIAKKTVQVLMEQIAGSEKKYRTIILKPELVIR
jgi:LacI family transcriptional regulator